jgi:CBS-domain-containing membrane protein
MTKFTALPTVSVGKDLIKPRPVGLLDLENNASEVYLNFMETRCRSVSEGDKLEYAEYILQRDRRHELVVENKDRHVVGILSTTDVISPKAVAAANNQRIQHDEVLVKAVMTPLEQIPAIDVGILVHAKIGNIIVTMNEQKAKFLLVTQKTSEGHELCGLFSLIHISQQLHKDVAK